MSHGPEAQYFAFLDEGRFMVQRCQSCARHAFYPRTLCPHCGAQQQEWVQATGFGTVYSFSVIAGEPARVIVLVDLEEGVRLMSQLEDVDTATVRIGLPVQARVQATGERAKVVFIPRSDA